MAQGYTSIEQSRKLIELGLDPSTADMFYNLSESQIPNVIYGNNDDFKCYLFAWSLTALLELMPESYQLTSSRDNKYQFMLINNLRSDWFNTSFEAVYSMVVWLLENKYTKKE